MLIFGKIDYINLLPLHIYLKKAPLPSTFKQIMAHKKGVPSVINYKLKKRCIDAAFISSIESPAYRCFDLGICAHKKVKSVLVRKSSTPKKDSASASSNALALVLNQKGEVIIGDRALKMYLQNPNDFTDLCALWHAKTGLPFVFACLACVKNKHLIEKIFKKFAHKKIFIPGYILEQYALSRGICAKEIKEYLKLIYYKINLKEKKALKLFLKKSKEKK